MNSNKAMRALAWVLSRRRFEELALQRSSTAVQVFGRLHDDSKGRRRLTIAQRNQEGNTGYADRRLKTKAIENVSQARDSSIAHRQYGVDLGPFGSSVNA
jgi:hypothetical protein